MTTFTETSSSFTVNNRDDIIFQFAFLNMPFPLASLVVWSILGFEVTQASYYHRTRQSEMCTF